MKKVVIKGFGMKLAVLIVWLITFVSCTPEEIEFPEEELVEEAFSKSNAIVSLLNALQTGETSLADLCFEFTYPISLKTQSGVVIEISSQEGLTELANNQTSGVHVDQVAFPLTVLKEEAFTIVDEQAFQELLVDCDIKPLALVFNTFYSNCFEFSYPFSLFDEVSNEVAINSNQERIEYFEDLPATTLLNLSYPIATSTDLTLQNDFELYQLLNGCELCPELLFNEVVIDDERKLQASFDLIEEVGAYTWLINDEEIERDGPDVGGDDFLRIYEFLAPGQYEVCIEASFAFCDDLLQFCQQITVETECPDLSFSSMLTDDDTYPDSLEYTFDITSPLEAFDNAEIEWFVNGELIAEGPFEDAKVFEDFFANGDYEICAKYSSNLCPEGVEVCQQLTVDIPDDDPCPDLFFVFQEIGDGEFIFIADFPGIESLEFYAWFVNDEFIEQEGTSSGGDNQLRFTFPEPGTYEVCIFTETPECPFGAQYCVEVTF